MGMTASKPLLQTALPGLPPAFRGKVRDLYELGDRLLIVATDRLSAFDHVLPTPIPDKGRILTRLSAFWFRRTAGIVPNHMLSADFDDIIRSLPAAAVLERRVFDGRLMLARKASRLDVECVVRGYLAGSAWTQYRETGAVCGLRLPAGLREAEKLRRPLFTPASKASSGHDENLSGERFAGLVGTRQAAALERLSLALYEDCAAYLEGRGLILADTKFEFGLWKGGLLLIDELGTPDSSRIWDAARYRPGSPPEGFDKQFVRDYLERIAWDKRSPPPELPAEVVEGVSRRYREALRRIVE